MLVNAWSTNNSMRNRIARSLISIFKAVETITKGEEQDPIDKDIRESQRSLWIDAGLTATMEAVEIRGNGESEIGNFGKLTPPLPLRGC